MLAPTLFILTYIGIALGKIPGVALDRVGIALLGAIAMVAFGVLTPEGAFRAIDLSTILLLYSLMIISAQLRLGGFYTWSALKVLTLLARPKRFLLALMLLSGLLSALLANDIVCFAFTPVLAAALIQAQLNPLPFLLGLAVASNIGSAATIIGNPQNMLIGQVGGLGFGRFALWCGIPSAARAVSLNVTVVSPSAAGDLLVYPADTNPGPPSTLSFGAGRTRASLAILGVSGDGTGSIRVRNRSPGPLDLVVDVNGYFAP